MRFYAAFTVIFYHLAKLSGMPVPDYMAAINKFGGYGVPLFYALSAFVLCIGYRGKLDNREQWVKFYRRRFFRIAPLFYVMMAIFAADQWRRTGTLVSFSHIITSATFTFNLIPGHTSGFVSASWSIGVEMLFYAIFPALLLMVTNLQRAVAFFALSCFLSALWNSGFQELDGPAAAPLGGLGLPSQLQYFAAGVLAFFLYQRLEWTALRHRMVILASVAAILALTALSSETVHFYGWAFGYDTTRGWVIATWAVAIGGLTAGMAFQRFSIRPLAITAWLGERSFSLYLWHAFIIQTMVREGVYESIADTFPNAGIAFAVAAMVTVPVVIAISVVSYRYIEKGLGQGLSRLASKRRHDTQVKAPLAS